MKTKYFLIEQQADGKLKAHALVDGTSMYRTVVHICAVRETVDVPASERSGS